MSTCPAAPRSFLHRIASRLYTAVCHSISTISPGRIALGLVIGIPLAATVIWLFDWSYRNGWLRYFLFVHVITAVLLTIGLTWVKRAQLIEGKRAGKPVKEQMKLSGELAAAWALIAFLGPHFQLSAQLDKLFPDPRPTQLIAITTAVNAALPPSSCAAWKQQLVCLAVADDLGLLKFQIDNHAETVISSTVERLTEKLREVRIPRDLRVIPQEIDNVIGAINRLDRGRDWLDFIVLILPIVSLVFGSFAVSSKVALAWLDLGEKREVPAMKRKHRFAHGAATRQPRLAIWRAPGLNARLFAARRAVPYPQKAVRRP